MQLLETIGPFCRGGARHYIDGKRVTEHKFCQILLKARSPKLEPDYIKHGLNQQKETTTRNYWNL